MKIGLLSPAMKDAYWKPGERSIFLFPPLSLMAIAGATPRQHEVEIQDESVAEFDLTRRYDLVGITCNTAVSTRAYDLADRIRGLGIPVVMGGFHPTIMPDEVLKHADAVVIGEGEGIWPKVLADVEAGKLATRYKADSALNPAAIPEPRHDTINLKNYVFPYVVQATRGCPWSCSFCASSLMWGRRFRHRPVSNVIREISQFRKRFFIFLDDNLFTQDDYSVELMKGLIPLKKYWVTQTDATLARNPYLIRLAAKAGCLAVLIGFESVVTANSPEIGKGCGNIEKHKEVVSILHRNGILVQGSFIIGFDGDTKEVFDQLLEFCHEVKIDTANFCLLTPLPGTRSYDLMRQEDRIIIDDWMYYNRETVVFKPKNLTARELIEGRLKLYREFYSLPSFLRRMPLSPKYLPLYLVYNWSFWRGARKLRERAPSLIALYDQYADKRQSSGPQLASGSDA